MVVNIGISLIKSCFVHTFQLLRPNPLELVFRCICENTCTPPNDSEIVARKLLVLGVHRFKIIVTQAHNCVTYLHQFPKYGPKMGLKTFTVFTCFLMLRREQMPGQTVNYRILQLAKNGF